MHFETTVLQLKEFLILKGFCNVSEFQCEVNVENLMDWSELGDLEDLKAWFVNQQQNCDLYVEDISLDQCRGWRYNDSLGRIEHNSGSFFYIQGVRVKKSSMREVEDGWDQPIVTQVGFDGGVLGLLRSKRNGVPYYLVEAKAEPGNPDKVQICPTLQATFSNINQKHGGRQPKFVDLFLKSSSHSSSKILFDQWMSEDGGRLHRKRNRGMLVEVPNMIDELEIPSGFKWISLFQIKKLLKLNSWVSPHIRGIISHL